ncbi:MULTISPECIES: TetR family transcriptional regulator [Kitasatospora]|uniref:Putative TetR family transcriptional regulator n=1 Tax=Kitasatospora setae (strain ATCC 33774 / DSM 43861 / JCM 3304 / KCC A-0304 / NBRC 14216 / KM-6054) TaxID=452652 RepID=E4NAB4_KITSK|nr:MULTISPECIES: TetR family transcriptional regulator [Kitasatospora]BAJ28145.1 putative TetR family transcriptional regulator [Kitasatospora setae KM-6054]
MSSEQPAPPAAVVSSAGPAAAADGRRGRKARRTREAMAAAALRRTLEHGLAALAVEDVTDAADVSRRTFSRHFASREDAVLDCLRADFARINEALAARPAAEPPVAAYRAAVAAWARDPEHPAWHRRPGMRDLFVLIDEEPALTAAFRRIAVAEEERSIRLVAARLGLDPATDLRPAVAVGLGVAALHAATRTWVRDPEGDLPTLLDRAFTLAAAEPPS